MKSLAVWNIVATGFVGLAFLGFQNCSAQNFGAGPVSAEATTPSSTPLPSGTPTVSAITTPTPSPTPPVSLVLYMTLQTPACGSHSDCIATFTLTDSQGTPQPQSQTLTFSWYTDDTQGTPNNGLAMPTVNYISTQGTVTFTPGETVQSIHVQSVIMNANLRIPFRWGNATLGTKSVPPPTLVGSTH
jgi:hypothetical protein